MAKGEDTRAMILQAGLAMASQVGLEGLSIGNLAKAVGLSKSGLFAHFNSLEKLQLAVLQAAVDRFVETVIAPALRQPRGEPRLRALFENQLAWSNAQFLPGGCLFIAAANEFDDRPGPIREFLVNAQKDLLETIAQAARIAVTAGHFRADLDAEQFAFQLYSLELGYHHFRRLLQDPLAETRYRQAAEALIQQSRR